MFLTHFDLEKDRVLDEDETKHFLADLEGRKMSVSDGSGDHAGHEAHYHREQVEPEVDPLPPVRSVEFDG